MKSKLDIDTHSFSQLRGAGAQGLNDAGDGLSVGGLSPSSGVAG